MPKTPTPATIAARLIPTTYNIALEWCGHATPRQVVRHQDGLVSLHETYSEAVAAALRHRLTAMERIGYPGDERQPFRDAIATLWTETTPAPPVPAETRTNDRLAAAAPELLEALKNFMRWNATTEQLEEFEEIARAAIAKATTDA